MKENKKSEECAQNRFKVITPVLVALDEGADEAKLAQVKREVCIQNGISRRTLMRWVDAHKKDGFNGLKPIPRSGGTSVLLEELIEEAILLRREVPMRSVSTLIEIIELEGKAPKGLIKESTLQEKLMERGFGARQMKLYQQTGVAARRFQRTERNDLWQADIKYGPFITVAGNKKQTYLVAFIDDATRYIVHAEFYGSKESVVVEDCLRKAIIKEGLPQRLYFDNGGEFRNKWMERVCAKLGIKLLYCKPYSPESKGKVERFNRTVDAFYAEASLQNLSTLDGYNRNLNIWLSECYHNREHSTLKTTPLIAYQTSKTPLRFVQPDVLAEAFLHQETRKVDKSGCITLGTRLYEVGIPLIGSKVEVLFDPADKSVVTVKHEKSGFEKRVAEYIIGTHTGERPKLPASMLPDTPGSSRLLNAKEAGYDKTNEIRRQAIKYAGMDWSFASQTARPCNPGDSYV